MKIIRNVTSNSAQEATKKYGNEVHVYLNQSEVEDAETENITYNYDKVIIENGLKYADPIEAATIYLNEIDKQKKLDEIIVTTSTGKSFYCDPVSRTDISDAIALSVETGQTTIDWKLSTGWENVSLSDMREARILGLQAKANIIGMLTDA